MQIVRASDAVEALPGEPVPASSYLAAMTILVDDVDDVDDSHKIVESSGTVTRPTGDGFFISARHAYGAGLFFTTG
ncbi:hypothetical protein PV367_31985 [Streptomyces europaeiscabiei]|uniref:Uncharacterized protein n=1 Tax=Streptomyces europaeiscabiei TaxID=146819 RepID=A0AAJ2PVQ7_9ACTN|nr:hypothetical protein [Streptomyces europaeiscabiei]MDX3134305.1 hypothetical protein [Streptomyces europaeiscabiei]